MAETGPLPTVRRHSIVGVFGGLVFGLGAAVLVVLHSFVALGTLPPILIVVGSTLLGGVWGRWGPVRTVGTPPKAGRPQADRRVRQAMSENSAAIDRAERELYDAEFAADARVAAAEAGEPVEDEEPTGALPDIGPPGEGVWPGDRSDRPADPPTNPPGPRAGSGEIGPQG